MVGFCLGSFTILAYILSLCMKTYIYIYYNRTVDNNKVHPTSVKRKKKGTQTLYNQEQFQSGLKTRGEKNWTYIVNIGQRNGNNLYLFPFIDNLNLLEMYMGGLALMVISTKKWEFSPFFMSTFGIIHPHLKSYSSEPQVEASHNMQKYDQKIFAITRQSNLNFFEF